MQRFINKTGLLLAFAFLFLAGLEANAQNPVSWSIKTGMTAQSGGKITAQVIAQISGGWHLYSLTQGAGGPIPTRVNVPDGQPFKLAGGVSGPRPKVKMDANFGINTETYEGLATFTLPISVAPDSPAGSQTLNVNVRFQACNDTMCIPPKTVKLSVPVTITTVSTIVATATPKPTPSENINSNSSANALANTNLSNPTESNVSPSTNSAATTETSEQIPSLNAKPEMLPDAGNQLSAPTVTGTGGIDQTLWSFIWLAMSVGALSLLTPCVFPMVPITVSYFTNHSASNRAGAVRDAVIYALGIILTFTALGVALALIFGAAGINKFAASPYVNLVITGIFIAFAMSLFGAFNLGIPSSILTKLDALQRKEEGKEEGSGHIIALLLMGLTFSLTSFTCTAPFVGTLLVMAAQGDWLYPVLGMLAFSSVFALPFFVLALVPQLVSQLPKSGGWLNSVKVVMGLLEIAAAMKFLSNVDLVWGWGVFTREVVLATWVAIALLIALYLLGKYQLSHDMPLERIGAGRLFASIIFLSLGFYFLTGLFGARLGELESFLPPASENSFVAKNNSDKESSELDWITNDYDAALQKAKTENKPIFIDFTGYTCTNCRWMEANMFPKDLIRQELEKYVRVRLYTDGEGEPYEEFQKMQEEKFATVALPLYAVVNPNGDRIATFPGLTRSESEFVSFLKSGQDKFVAAGQKELSRSAN